MSPSPTKVPSRGCPTHVSFDKLGVNCQTWLPFAAPIRICCALSQRRRTQLTAAAGRKRERLAACDSFGALIMLAVSDATAHGRKGCGGGEEGWGPRGLVDGNSSGGVARTQMWMFTVIWKQAAPRRGGEIF
eukprot:scaffold202711_cov32-Tisochrysis_lutea.AAC.1